MLSVDILCGAKGAWVINIVVLDFVFVKFVNHFNRSFSRCNYKVENIIIAFEQKFLVKLRQRKRVSKSKRKKKRK